MVARFPDAEHFVDYLLKLYNDDTKEFQILFETAQLVETPRGRAYVPGYGAVHRNGIREVKADCFVIEGDVADDKGIHKGIIVVPFSQIKAVYSFSPLAFK